MPSQGTVRLNQVRQAIREKKPFHSRTREGKKNVNAHVVGVAKNRGWENETGA